MRKEKQEVKVKRKSSKNKNVKQKKSILVNSGCGGVQNKGKNKKSLKQNAKNYLNQGKKRHAKINSKLSKLEREGVINNTK